MNLSFPLKPLFHVWTYGKCVWSSFNDNNRPPAIKGFKCQEHNLCGFEKRDYLCAILMQQHWNTNHFHISRKIFLHIFLRKSKWKFQGFHAECFYICVIVWEGKKRDGRYFLPNCDVNFKDFIMLFRSNSTFSKSLTWNTVLWPFGGL